MVPSTLQAVLALVLVVLPGAIYLWGFEREAGKWAIGISDTLLRFVAASAIFQALYAAPLYLLYERYVHDEVSRSGTAVFENPLSDGHVPSWLALVPLAYVGLPAALGTLVGRSVRSERAVAQRFARIMAGRNPAPRAWDDLFAGRPSGTVRARLKVDSSWVGGLFGEDSYAAGYPEEPQDLLLQQSYKMSADGSFVEEDGDFVVIGSRLLIRFEEIDVLEFFPA
jgi:uncharacterized protein DUF6338